MSRRPTLRVAVVCSIPVACNQATADFNARGNIAGLAEALDWAQSVALFRRVGDHLYAANTLFNIGATVNERRQLRRLGAQAAD